MENQIIRRFTDDKRIAQKIALELAGKRFLVIDSYLDDNVEGYIHSLGGKLDTYQKYIGETKNIFHYIKMQKYKNIKIVT